MSEWSGKVSKINDRKWGSDTLWSFQIEGANVWLRLDGFEPDFEIGDWVSAEGDSPNKITKVVKTDAEAVKQRSDSGVSGKNGSIRKEAPPTNSPDYWRWKQMHDLQREDVFLYRDARSDATRLICAALDNDILSLGTKKAARLDVLRAMVNELTEQYVTEMKEKVGG